jgi:threonyl-tRNA synthetase
VYVDENNNDQTPLCIHRAPLGTHERFVGFLIEHFGGDFPLWLAPKQVIILPVSDKYLSYADALEKKMLDNNIRVSIDSRSEKMGAKIRDAEIKKIPMMLIVGEKEENDGSASVRRRHIGDLGSTSIDELIPEIVDEITTRRRA